MAEAKRHGRKVHCIVTTQNLHFYTPFCTIDDFDNISHFGHSADMRRDVQEIFRATPHHKQVMMFSATLAKEIRVTCKKFMANVSTFWASTDVNSYVFL